MQIDFESLVSSLKSGITYIPNTLLLVLIPIVFSLIFGTLVAYARVEKVKVVSQIFAVFITIYRGIPTVVALLLYNLLFLTEYEKIQKFFHLKTSIQDINVIWIAVFALSLQTFCLTEENLRSAFLSIDKGQWEAGYSVGMTKWQILKEIIIPQLIPVAIPFLTSILVGLVKNSSIVISVGVVDIMVGCTIPANVNYRFFEAYLAAALIYWGINAILEFLMRQYEKHGKRFKKEVA